MDSATSSAPPAPSSQSPPEPLFTTRAVITGPSGEPLLRLPVGANIPRTREYGRVLDTIHRVQQRKRQREEAEFNRRNVGAQTCGYDYGLVRSQSDGQISETKRIRREIDPSDPPQDPTPTESVGTNTSSPPPLQYLAAFQPTIQTSSLGGSRNPSLNQQVDAFLNAATRPSVPSGSSEPSTAPGPSSRPSRPLPEETRLQARMIRRANRSRRTHQDGPRLQTDLAQQQITGMVPISEHNCQLHCHLHNHFHSMSSSGPHSVSPAVAPAAMATIRGHIAPPAFPFPHPPYLAPLAAPIVPVMMGIVPMHVAPTPLAAPAVIPPNIYAFRAPLGIPPTMGIHEIFTNILRSNDIIYPSIDRNGVDRHHMFAGLDIDVPVGATRGEIDLCTVAEKYEKPEKDDEEGTCTVCLSGYEPGESIRKLPCNHFFHPECIEKWLDINKRCPMCREEIDRKNAVTVQ